MKTKKKDVILERLELFKTGGPYRSWEKTSLKSLIYKTVSQITDLKLRKNTGRITFSEAKLSYEKGEFTDGSIGDIFKTLWETNWFHFTMPISKIKKMGLAEDSELHFLWDSSSEAMLYSAKGVPLQGFNGDKDVSYRNAYIIPSSATEDEEYYIEMANCGKQGNFVNGDMARGIDYDREFILRQCEISEFKREAWELLLDFTIISDSARLLHTRGEEAMSIGLRMIKQCNLDDPDTFAPCKAIGREFLSVENGGGQCEVYGIGHCHIDVGWLWPFQESRRKAARSWSSQIQLMKQYPKYKFTASQSVLYEWVQNDYPILFDQIKQYAASGQFLPTGGTYVEFDGNLPSGESIARQFLYGQTYFKNNFQTYCDIFFLPDTFGYNGNLPQIAKLAGITNFFSQKLNWNYFNKPPHSTFFWKGIDGSEMLSHFPPADNYGTFGEVEEVLKSQTNFKDKGRSHSSLLLFGLGDGGGGPLPEMIEKLTRMEDLDGIPKVSLSSPSEFYANLRKEGKNLVSWEGELFFEFHNGTYTSQAGCKKSNRESECQLRNAEMLSVFDSLLAGLTEKGVYNYNKEMFDYCWKKVMLYQFHDVLPGASMDLIYEETRKGYKEVQQKLSEDIITSFQNIINNLVKIDPDGQQNAIAMFNPLPFQREELFGVAINTIKFFSKVQIPPFGFLIAPITQLYMNQVQTPEIDIAVTDGLITLENSLICVKIEESSGKIISFLDKDFEELGEPKEIISSTNELSGGNILCLHKDVPKYWDAWDLWISYTESKQELLPSRYTISNNKLNESSVTFYYEGFPFLNTSRMEIEIVMYPDSKRVDFKTNITWKEDHKILRVYFPLNIKAPFVTCDIQCGNIKRPTNSNTSWELAKYEFCAHKYVDMSDHNYGVALLNDCKYGYSAKSNVLGMSLLKSPKGPDPEADMGEHQFIYALYPHKYDFAQADVTVEAHKLNVNVISEVISVQEEKETMLSFFQIDKTNIAINAIKFDEEMNSHIIIRMNEDKGEQCNARLTHQLNNPQIARFQQRILGISFFEESKSHTKKAEENKKKFEFKDVKIVNILEELIDDSDNLLDFSEEEIILKFKPFQIITLKIEYLFI